MVLDLASSGAQVAGNHEFETFFYQYWTGRNVLFADGSVQFCIHGLDRVFWTSLLGINNGAVSLDDYPNPPMVERRLKIGACVRLGFFLLIALFPLPWIWRSPKRHQTSVVAPAHA